LRTGGFLVFAFFRIAFFALVFFASPFFRLGFFVLAFCCLAFSSPLASCFSSLSSRSPSSVSFSLLAVLASRRALAVIRCFAIRPFFRLAFFSHLRPVFRARDSSRFYFA
jgi:hypothetical protein